MAFQGIVRDLYTVKQALQSLQAANKHANTCKACMQIKLNYFTQGKCPVHSLLPERGCCARVGS
jgi:hypothetical protein